MSVAKKLQAIDVKNEVKRIKKLVKDEQEAHLDALHDKIKTEIDAYYNQIDTMNSNEQKSEYSRLYSCVIAHKWKWEGKLWRYLSEKSKEWSECVEGRKDDDTEASTKKLQAEDVKNEVARIKKLPKEEQEEQLDILYDKIKKEIDAYYDRIDTMTIDEQESEYSRLYSCVMAHKFKWNKRLLYYILDKKSERNDRSGSEKDNKKDTNKNASQYMMKKVNTAHVSGLPLPEQAEVDIWWKDDKLIFASAATEFSLPVERIMGMGIKRDNSLFWDEKTYLTIEYKKEDEMKAIVVCVAWKFEVSHLKKHFDKIKGTREMNKQEL